VGMRTGKAPIPAPAWEDASHHLRPAATGDTPLGMPSLIRCSTQCQRPCLRPIHPSAAEENDMRSPPVRACSTNKSSTSQLRYTTQSGAHKGRPSSVQASMASIRVRLANPVHHFSCSLISTLEKDRCEKGDC
jgi:hypothetical protein